MAGLVIQFSTRRYRAFAHWFLAYAIEIFGTGVSDLLHLDLGIPGVRTTLLWRLYWRQYSGPGISGKERVHPQRHDPTT